MKKILYKSFAIALMSVFMLTGFTGCTKEYYTDEYYTDEHYYVGSEVVTRTYTIKQNQWEWNDVYNRYECIVENIKEINEEIYEYGSIIGTIFVVEEAWDGSTYEVQKTLPFVQSYNEPGIPYPYTETISFDIYYGGGDSGSLTFYIQTSDTEGGTPILAKEYTFKVAYVRDSGY